MIIPLDQLSDDALNGLIEEYCIREHGLNETESPLTERKATILAALRRGEVVVLYTPNNPNQVATLVNRDQLGDRDLAALDL
ncbi:YheU family protein [Mangrovitalea sediminis]|uniref:YheU family protein n=1 Tax=Mangrovitalea sediminis TaxID=1982043 RepID=UPI001D0D5553|nr:YheU family protein [Mangrovitalea sediminis]